MIFSSQLTVSSVIILLTGLPLFVIIRSLFKKAGVPNEYVVHKPLVQLRVFRQYFVPDSVEVSREEKPIVEGG